MTTCPRRSCVTRLRQHIAERFSYTDVPAPEQPPMVAMACYGIAQLATDATELSYLLHNHKGIGWEDFEGFLAATAEQFPWEIEALRDHLTPEEQGVGQDVPTWVLREFVKWPVGEMSHG